MKIAIINTTFQQGSIGKIVNHFYHNAKNDGHEVKLFYGRDHAKTQDTDIINFAKKCEIYLHAILARLTGLEGSFSFFSTKRLIKQLNNFSPDLIFIGSLLGYYINEKYLFKYINSQNLLSLYCMMDEYSYMGKCCYPFECEKFKANCGNCKEKKAYPPSWFFDTSRKKQKMKTLLYGNRKNIIFIGPKWVCERAKESSILKNSIVHTVDEAIDLNNIFYPKDISTLRKELKIPEDNKIILNVCPVSDQRKGAEYYFNAIELVENQHISFIQVGCDDKKHKYPDKLLKIGYIKNQDRLSEFYSLADVLVCSSLCDTMPNVCLEALACGTPIIGFNISGIPYVASEKYGTFIEPRNTRMLAEIMDKFPKKSESRKQECRAYAIQRYSHHKFYTSIMNIVKEKRQNDSI